MTESIKRLLPDVGVIALLVIAYLGLDAFLNAHGMFFVATPLKHFWQVLDPAWLENDLWRSLLYLHAQPPFFNALIGVGLQSFGKAFVESFDRLYQIVAVCIVILLYVNQRLLNVARWLAVSLSLVWMVYPAFLYFQNFLFYPIWVQLFLLLSFLFLQLALQRNWQYLFGFFAAILLLFLTRSTFNLAYFVFSVIALLLTRRWAVKKVFLSAVPTLLIITLWTFKNLWLFGEVSTSSWLGMNLANLVLSGVSQTERAEWVERGKVSVLALSTPFNDIQDYPHEIWAARAKNCSNPAALCEMYKTNGEPNYNFIGYLDVSKQFLKSDWFVIRTYPQYIFPQIARAWQMYFLPSVRTVFLNQRAFAPIAPLANWSDRLLCGTVVQDVYTQPACVPLQAGYWLVYLLAVLIFLTHPSRPPFHLALLFCLLTLLYAVGVGTLLDLGENNRFRFETEPLWVITLSYALSAFKTRYQYETSSKN